MITQSFTRAVPALTSCSFLRSELETLASGLHFNLCTRYTLTFAAWIASSLHGDSSNYHWSVRTRTIMASQYLPCLISHQTGNRYTKSMSLHKRMMYTKHISERRTLLRRLKRISDVFLLSVVWISSTRMSRIAPLRNNYQMNLKQKHPKKKLPVSSL